MNEIRIISGEFKGRKIKTPGEKTHPMGERERIALFNMIFEVLDGERVLDAFSGSGALGIEALSRGASFVTFIEKDSNACRVIRGNLEAIGAAQDKYEVVKADVYKATEAWIGEGRKYGAVIADPPYDEYDGEKMCNFGGLVANGGVLVLSHPGDAPEIEGMKLLKTRQYAAAHLSVYVK